MNRTSLRRIAAPGVAALALGLASQPAAPATKPRRATAAAAAPPLRHPQRGRLQRPGGRPGRLDRRLPGRQRRRHRQLRPVRLRRRRRSSSSPAASTSPARTPTSTTPRASSPPPRSAAAADALEVPDYISPIALVYNLDGVDELQLSAKTIADIFAGKITTWNDPAIKADNPDAKLPRPRSPRCTARTTRAPRRTSPTT